MPWFLVCPMYTIQTYLYLENAQNFTFCFITSEMVLLISLQARASYVFPARLSSKTASIISLTLLSENRLVGSRRNVLMGSRWLTLLPPFEHTLEGRELGASDPPTWRRFESPCRNWLLGKSRCTMAAMPLLSSRRFSATRNCARFLIFTAIFLARIIPSMLGPPLKDEPLEWAPAAKLILQLGYNVKTPRGGSEYGSRKSPLDTSRSCRCLERKRVLV